MAEPVPDTPGADPGAAAPASLLDQVHALWRELPGLVSDRVELLSLELQRAAQALLQIVALTVAVAILGVTAWLMLWAAAVHLLVQAGMSPPLALLLAIALNGLAIALALLRVRRLLPRLKLPATRRHLMISPDPRPQEGHDERTAAGHAAAR